jgi:3-oxoacyl-(acyl-carrier-protein) synthase
MNGAAISVKGIGVVSPCGNSRDEILAAARGNAPQPGALSFERFSEIPDARGYRCAFPEAKEYVSPSRLRRFGRIINMSLLAARKALLDAGGGLATPEESSVFYGTGLGSHGDTAVFLENMVKNDEQFPKPASFVNSVHNAAAAQVAIELGLKGENLTFTHRQVSFHAALWHALHSVSEGRSKRVLVGGADELDYYQILAGRERGAWKRGECTLRPLEDRGSARRGSLPGEGASICILEPAGERSEGDVKVGAVSVRRFAISKKTYVDVPASAALVQSVLERSGIAPTDDRPVLMLVGANGDCRIDRAYARIADEMSRRRPTVLGRYKHLTGDHLACAAFGFALGALMLEEGCIPQGILAPTAMGRDMSSSNDAEPAAVVLYDFTRYGSHAACVLMK